MLTFRWGNTKEGAAGGLLIPLGKHQGDCRRRESHGNSYIPLTGTQQKTHRMLKDFENTSIPLRETGFRTLHIVRVGT